MKKQFKSGIDVEYDVNSIVSYITREYDLPSDWYGDTYGSLIETETGVNLMNKAQFVENEEEYQECMDEIESNFRSQAEYEKSRDDDEE